MSRYKIKTLALLSVIPILFTACTLQELPIIGKYIKVPSRPVELKIWGLWEKDYLYEPLVREYQNDSPNVSVVYEDMSVLKLAHLVEYKARVFSRLEQEDWDTDIVMIHNSWVPRLVRSGYLEPMTSGTMSTEKYSELFYPIAYESAVSGGKIYAIPAYYDGLVLVYNKRHFQEINQLSPPTAWEEFRRLAIDLTVRSDDGKDVIRGGAAVGAADNIAHFSDILGLMWSQAGIRIPDTIDSASAQDALTFYLDLMRENKVWKEGFPEATTAFVNGQVSMIFVPSWQILDILEAAPDLRVGVAPVPQALADRPVTWGSFWMYSVPANSGSKKEAWEFLNYLATEDAEKMMYSEAARTRSFGSVYGLTSLGSSLRSHPYLGPLVYTAPYAKSAEIAARSGNRMQVEELRSVISSVISGERTVASALSEAKSKLSPVR